MKVKVFVATLLYSITLISSITTACSLAMRPGYQQLGLERVTNSSGWFVGWTGTVSGFSYQKWFENAMILDVDTGSFEILSPLDYAKDKDQVFFQGKVITGAQSSGFEVLPIKEGSYGKIPYAHNTITKSLYQNGVLLGTYKDLRLIGKSPYDSNYQGFITAKNIFSPTERLGTLFGRIEDVIMTPIDNEYNLPYPTIKRNDNNSQALLEYIAFAQSYYDQDQYPLANQYAVMQINHMIEKGEPNPHINILGSDGFTETTNAFDAIVADKYFLYNFVSYSDQCGGAEDSLVLPNPYLLSVLHKRSSMLSLPKRTYRKTYIQDRLNSEKNLTDQDRAVLIGALYVLNKEPLNVSRKDAGLYPVGCDTRTGAIIEDLGLSFEYPTCRGRITVEKTSQHHYFTIMYGFDIVSAEDLAKASKTGYFYQIRFSNLNGPNMRIENKDPSINYGKIDKGASLYDYAVQKKAGGGLERLEGVRFFDACFMGSCGDNDLMTTLGMQKRINKGDYNYVFMRFGVIDEDKQLASRVSDVIYPRFQSTQDYITQRKIDHPRTSMDYKDGYRGDIINNLNNNPRIDLSHTEVVNMMKRFYDSIK